jgi:hypothetical protein
VRGYEVDYDFGQKKPAKLFINARRIPRRQPDAPQIMLAISGGPPEDKGRANAADR